MWKLLRYDISKNRRYVWTSLICSLIVIAIPFSDTTASAFHGYNIDLFSPIWVDIGLIISSFIIFQGMFSKRFMKDDILVLSSISRKHIALEPIIFMIVYSLLVSIIVAIFTITTPYMLQHIFISFSGVLIIFSCVLSFWNAMNEHRGTNNFVAGSTLVILIMYTILYLQAPILKWSLPACLFVSVITLILCIILNISFYYKYINLID